jgi:hypothetical protein
MLSQTNINQSEKYFKSNRIRLSMDMDLAVAKLNLAELPCQEEERSDEPTQRSKRLDKQGMLKEQITMMKGQMKNITSKRANKIICLFYYILHQETKNNKKYSPKSRILTSYSFVFNLQINNCLMEFRLCTFICSVSQSCTAKPRIVNFKIL